MTTPLLEVRNASKVFASGLLNKRRTVALEDFSLTIPSERPVVTAIAGESGSGKTTLARLVLGFLTPTNGEILFHGKNVAQMDSRELQVYRREVQAVFQDPYEVYNPFYRVDHVFHLLFENFNLANSRAEARRLTEEALSVVGLRPDEILGKFPHQLSGGQRQRIMVARAFLLKPRLIVADEPVSMVDASLRAMILQLMLKLKNEYGISFLYITHDLSTAYQIGDDIYVLYRGTVAETGEVGAVIQRPQHPYTKLLTSSIPVPDPDVKWQGRIELPTEEELQLNGAAGCKFYRRCPFAMPVCAESPPPLYNVGREQRASCYLYREKTVDA